MNNNDNKLIRIGVFYDGGFFSHVSNYYNYNHSRKARLSIDGLHDFIRKQVSDYEGVDIRYCHVVEAHYFRGRYGARDAENMNKLLADRIFDDILMRSGVVTHYLPVTSRGEKGIDVWLALEALELTIHKKYNILVLIAGDGDFVSLVRKINALGTRVMVLGWDFEYIDFNNEKKTTTTSQTLLNEITYPVLMHTIIDDKSRKTDPYINGLFVEKTPSELSMVNTTKRSQKYINENLKGKIKVLKDGYGFITVEHQNKDYFFYWDELINKDFNQLSIGEAVEFKIGNNEKGECAIEIIIL